MKGYQNDFSLPPAYTGLAIHAGHWPANGRVVLLPWGSFQYEAAGDLIFREFAKLNLMFLQDDGPVELITNSDGEIVLRKVGSDAFCPLLNRLGTVMGPREDNKGHAVVRAVDASERIARCLLKTKASRDHLNPISLLTRCEVVTVDPEGKFKILRQGYHRELGGTFVTALHPTPEVPLAQATQSLLRLLNDFLFLTPSSRSRALAAFLNPALTMGGLLENERAPIELTMALRSKSGKSYLQKCIAASYGEIRQLIPQIKGGVGGTDEAFAYALLAGKHFIAFDDFRGELESQYLTQFMTAEAKISVRVLYRRAAVSARRFTVAITSNALNITTDLFNRSSVVMLEKRPSKYEFTEYGGIDLERHIRNDWSFYQGCIFAVVKAWVEAGRPQTREHRHPHKRWARSLDWIIQNIFSGMAPLMDDYEEIQQCLNLKVKPEPEISDGDTFFDTGLL